jgi:hypothetical protein
MRFRILAAAETSRPAVGSSATRNSGLRASARAIPTRRACPPESSWGYFDQLGREFHHLEQLADRVLLAGRHVVDPVRLCEKRGHAQAGAQARVRVLEDHLHAGSQSPERRS